MSKRNDSTLSISKLFFTGNRVRLFLIFSLFYVYLSAYDEDYSIEDPSLIDLPVVAKSPIFVQPDLGKNSKAPKNSSSSDLGGRIKKILGKFVRI